MRSPNVDIAEVPFTGAVQVKTCRPGAPSVLLVPAGLGGEVRVLTYSPREWVLVCERMGGAELTMRVTQHVRGESLAVVDVSSGLKRLRVEGAGAAEVLSQGCGLDLHPRGFPAGRCTRTRLAQLAVILDYRSPAPRFDLYVGRSYLEWLKSWLLDATGNLT